MLGDAVWVWGWQSGWKNECCGCGEKSKSSQKNDRRVGRGDLSISGLFSIRIEVSNKSANLSLT